MIDAFVFTAALALPSLGSGQGMGKGGQDPREQSVGVAPAEGAARTIRIEWDDTHVGARVRLKDGTTIRWRGTQVPEGGAIIELPLHESWTFCFLNHGSGLTIDSLRRLQPELMRIRVSGIEIYNCWEMSDGMLRLISEVASLERVVLGDQSSVVRGPQGGMTAAGLRQLAELPKLEYAFLVCLDYLTDEDFAAVVTALPQLKSVGFYGCGVDRRRQNPGLCGHRSRLPRARWEFTERIHPGPVRKVGQGGLGRSGEGPVPQRSLPGTSWRFGPLGSSNSRERR